MNLLDRDPSVAVDTCLIDDVDCYNIKISTPVVEVHVIVTPAEVPLFARVRQTPSLTGALQIGRSVGSLVWWSVEDVDGP
jgi:hypothetical protein